MIDKHRFLLMLRLHRDLKAQEHSLEFAPLFQREISLDGRRFLPLSHLAQTDPLSPTRLVISDKSMKSKMPEFPLPISQRNRFLHENYPSRTTQP